MAKKQKKRLIDWTLLGEYIRVFFKALKWPITVVIVAFIVSPRFWPRQVAHYNAILVLDYINALKWPIVVLILAAIMRPYLPELFRRLRKFGAGPVSGEFAPPSPQVSDTDALKADEDSSEPATVAVPDTDDIDTLLTSDQAKIAYEQVYAAIFGSQLSLLKRLNSNIPTGLTQDKLEDIYKAHVSSIDTPYPSFIHFVQYLIDNILVLYEPQTGLYKITNAGVYFLKYLIDTNRYELYKQY